MHARFRLCKQCCIDQQFDLPCQHHPQAGQQICNACTFQAVPAMLHGPALSNTWAHIGIAINQQRPAHSVASKAQASSQAVHVVQQLAWRMNNRVFAARNYALRHLIDTWVEEYLPGKDPRVPLGQDCRDAVVLFGPSQPQAVAPALPAANRSRLPQPEPTANSRASAMLAGSGGNQTAAASDRPPTAGLSALERARDRFREVANRVQA